VLILDNRIAGYYTLSSTNVAVNDLPPEIQRKLPHYLTIGGTLIGRLARDQSFRGQGIGQLLLVEALKVSLAMSRQIASYAVLVDAKDEKAAQFYSNFGFTPFPDAANRLYLRMETIRKLFP
jgi:predicted GNAT family N-acyltransferase